MCTRILSAKYGKEALKLKAVKNKERIDRHYIPLEGIETRKEAQATRTRKPWRPERRKPWYLVRILKTRKEGQETRKKKSLVSRKESWKPETEAQETRKKLLCLEAWRP
jgi:hypothetical protein